LPELRLSPSWLKGWREAAQKLQAAERFVLNQSLKELAEALRTCRDPMLDPELRRWSPSRWEVPRAQATAGQWVEYRLGDSENRGRVIVCCDREEDAIYLVAATPIHDHASLRAMVRGFQPK